MSTEQRSVTVAELETGSRRVAAVAHLRDRCLAATPLGPQISAPMARVAVSLAMRV